MGRGCVGRGWREIALLGDKMSKFIVDLEMNTVFLGALFGELPLN